MVGIEKISFAVPKYYLDLKELAAYQNIDFEKYYKGLMQEKMAYNGLEDDIITLGYRSAYDILTPEDCAQIDLVIVGSESAVDHSKTAAVYLQKFLNINPYARCYEIKQACYGGTAALMHAYNHVKLHPQSKALVITSDLARYDALSSAAATQGSGAVAMLISSQPKVAILNGDNCYFSEESTDFFRPIGKRYAVVDGPLSNSQYIKLLHKVYDQHAEKFPELHQKITTYLFHTPYRKLAYKSLKEITEDEQYFATATYYNKEVGNIYTGSLYLSLLSLLENTQLPAGSVIGMYSYGSGSTAEFFTVTLAENYHQHLYTEKHQKMLAQRIPLNIETYLKINNEEVFLENEYPLAYTGSENEIRKYQ